MFAIQSQALCSHLIQYYVFACDRDSSTWHIVSNTVCEFDYPTLMQRYLHWLILHDTQAKVLEHIYSIHLHGLIGIFAERANVNKVREENFILFEIRVVYLFSGVQVPATKWRKNIWWCECRATDNIYNEIVTFIESVSKQSRKIRAVKNDVNLVITD